MSNNKNNKQKNNLKSEKKISNDKKSIKIQTTNVYNTDNLKIVNNDVKKNTTNIKQKNEISSGEVVDKMLSIGKSFFVNGTIIIAITTIVVGGGIFFSGYDPIPLIEKYFIYTSDETDTDVDEIVELPSLNLSKDLISEDKFKDYYDLVNKDLQEVILNKDLFDEGREAFNLKMNKFYSKNYIEKLSTNDVIYNVLNSIYEDGEKYPYSVTLTSIGKVMKDNKPFTKLSIDVIADDIMNFYVWNLALFLDSDNKISDIKIIAENKTMKNTRTPLDPNLAVISNGGNDSLYRTVNTFLKNISNENLYNKFVASSKSFNETQLKAFFSKLNIREKDYDVLSEMFKVSRGNGSNFAITEFISTDFDGEPITNIILSLKSGDNLYRYDLQYNRREKALIKVSKL